MKKERKMRFKPDYSSRFRILKGGKISLVVSAFLGSVTLSFAAPSGGVVTSGSATINQSGKVTNINQSTQKASINWQKFNVAIDETVNFNQPNVNSITLNRVVGNERSVINGALNANGQVWILNSNGVLFGKNAKINTAGLLATTKELSDQEFQAGNYTFKGDSTASVINLGEIDISDSGYVTLLANSVSNEGSIKAIKGSIRLIGANEVAINFNGNSIVDLTVNKGVLDALVENKGAIYADGGQVYLTTNAVDELLKGVVNNEGIIEANSFESVTGYVELFAHGGTANISGNINAVDGFVETSGDRVKIDDDFRVKANKWLIDPKDFTIASSGGDITGATLSSNLEGASVEIKSIEGATDGDGDIFVNDAISWDAATKLTLNAQNDIFINQSITATNAAGQLALYYGQGAVSTGNTADYYVKAPINLKAGNNFFTKKGNNGAETIWTVITHENLATAITTGGLGHNYVLGSDLDLSGIAWNPIGTNSSNAFTGSFDGLGHVIDNLTINDNSLAPAGLFGYTTDAAIKNIGLTNLNISARARAGGLAGQANNTTIKNVFAEGFITGATNDRIGGLVGYSNGSNIDNSYAKVNIIISDNSSVSQAVGGLVGWNYSASSVIKNSYSSGTITLNTDSSSRTNIGGLVGKNDGNINTSYYDKNRNTANMADSATYGKTKAEIVTALSSLDAWTAGGAGGDSVEGYSTATALTLPQLVAFYTSNGEILFAGGFGTEADPYTITNWTQLQNINNSNILTQNYYFKLLNDLLTNTEGYATQVKDGATLANGGTGWKPIGDNSNRFVGELDGQNHIIDWLIIDRSGSDYQGLFGYADGAIIKNIGLTNVNIVGKNSIGGLVGKGIADISNSYVSGTISGEYNVGGIMGSADDGTTLRNIYSTGTITVNNAYGGGIIGYAHSGVTSENIYSSTVVTGDFGLHQNVGANSFYDNEVNSESMADSQNGRTTAQMKDIDTFIDAGWDIESYTASENTYPTLAWQDSGDDKSSVWIIGQKAASTGGGTTGGGTTTDGGTTSAGTTNEEQQKVIDKVITTIVNQEAVTITVPRVQTTTTTPNNAGQNVAVNFNVGENQMLISQPIEGQLTQRITLGEARQMQLESGVSGEEVRIPLSRSSMIELVNGGVNLPDGVEQEFYVAENN